MLILFFFFYFGGFENTTLVPVKSICQYDKIEIIANFKVFYLLFTFEIRFVMIATLEIAGILPTKIHFVYALLCKQLISIFHYLRDVKCFRNFHITFYVIDGNQNCYSLARITKFRRIVSIF